MANATIVKKSDLQFKEGRVFMGNTLVELPCVIVTQLSNLDLQLQRAIYNRDNQIEPQKVIDPFKRKSFSNARKVDLGLTKPETPVTDSIESQKKNVEKEAILVDVHDEIERLGKLYKDVVFFVEDDDVLITEEVCSAMIDTPELGNPFELTKEKLIEIFTEIAKWDSDIDPLTFVDRDGDR